MTTPLILGILALLLAGVAPRLLSRAGLLRRAPMSALLLWQAVTLAALLAAVGAGLSLATHLWRSRPDGDTAWRIGVGPLSLPLGLAVAAFVVVLTAGALIRLGYSGHRVGRELRALRREHREYLDVLARGAGDTGGRREMSVLDHEVPVAYCVPAVGRSRVVVSAGALSRLEPDQLAVVLAHESAHLDARHDLVLEAFSVLREAFPPWMTHPPAVREVGLLVEVSADRRAARNREQRRHLARALVTLAEGRVGTTGPAGSGVGLAAARSGLVERVRLLGDEGRHRVQSTVVATAAVAVVALPTIFIALPWLTSLN